VKLFKVYTGAIKAMQNTPCKVAIFTDGKYIKVFQKAFYKNNLNRPNWVRNIILEKNNSVNSIEEKLLSSGFKNCGECLK
jgi:hypothetical protein